MAKILVADDDQAILDSTRLLLEYEGYEVLTTSNGEGVKKNIKDNFPNLILLDIWLSGANGGEIAQELKSEEMTKNLPIIIFSANRDIEKIAKEAGADDFLIKPFNLETLLAKVEKYIDCCAK